MAFGLTTEGFSLKRQQDIIAETQASLQAAFGQAINLLPESVFGQIVGIFSEREALIWELAEAVYSSQYPSGAEGTSVDNILALNNLRRLAAAPSIAEVTLRGTPATLIPAGSLISVLGTPTSQFATDEDATIAAAVNEIQTLAFTANPTIGQFTMTIVDPDGNTLTTTPIAFCSPAATGTSVLKGPVAPTGGQYKITVNGLSTGFLQYSDGAATIQTAIRLLSGYGSITVAGASFTAGFTITWTGVSTSEGRLASITSNTLNQTVNAGNTIQDVIRALEDGIETPYDDVTVSGNFTTGFTITFAGATSGSQPQNSFAVLSNSLFSGATAVNITVIESQKGAYAEIIVAATCTQDGEIFAPAGTLTVIDTPISGWTSVTNAEDASVGREIETDTEALQRRLTLLASNASSPLQSITQKIAALDDVEAAVGFENISIDTDYSSVAMLFDQTPTVGQFSLLLGGPFGVTTGLIDWNDTADDIQTIIQALGSPYDDVTVSGTFADGFFIFFGADFISQEPPVEATNTLQHSGDPVVMTLSGRPGKSFEIVVQGGDEDEIADTIWANKPAGIEAYGAVGPFIITDDFGQSYDIFFSRPSEVPIYINIAMNVNQSLFPLDGVQQIQESLVTIGDALNIGQTVITFGSEGLVGAFNGVDGIVSYVLTVGKTATPVDDDNILMQPQQIATFDTSRIIVTVTYV